MSRNYNGLGSKFSTNCRKLVYAIFDYVDECKFGSMWPGSGYRSDSVEHATGRAFDLMICGLGKRPTAQQKVDADKLVSWLIANGKKLGIQWIIFGKDGKQSWSYRISRGSWRALGGRGSISANHIDHIHIYFEANAKLPDNFNPSKPAENKPVTPNTGPKLVSTVSISDLKKARYADPPKKGTPYGPYADQVFTLETALVKTRWMRAEDKDGHYGTRTVGDGSSGYGGATGFQVKHSNATDPDGWLGEKELNLLFKLAKMNTKATP